MKSRNGLGNWLFTYGGWAVLAVLVAVWVLPVPRTVRLVVSIAGVALCVVMHVALQMRRRAESGGER
ncbi:MAG: hypothetical protein ACRDP3_04025 [Streptomyces sp.]|uniref:hypothetical protein n=1 Tax=Streptomyces sp. TaxID=1931 RepID=UPI003D6ADA96